MMLLISFDFLLFHHNLGKPKKIKTFKYYLQQLLFDDEI